MEREIDMSDMPAKAFPGLDAYSASAGLVAKTGKEGRIPSNNDNCKRDSGE